MVNAVFIVSLTCAYKESLLKFKIRNLNFKRD